MLSLSKVQRNDLFYAVISGGLEISECKIDVHEIDYMNSMDEAARIRHLSSESYFSIRRGDTELKDRGLYGVSQAIGNDPALPGVKAAEWNSILAYARQWSTDVRAYLNIPDLWWESRYVRQFMSGIPYGSIGNAAFTNDERVTISARLNQIARYVQQAHLLSQEQISGMEAAFAEAERASQRVGRKDWLLLLIGTVSTLVVTDLLPPEVAQHILAMILQGVHHLFGIHLRQLGG